MTFALISAVIKHDARKVVATLVIPKTVDLSKFVLFRDWNHTFIVTAHADVVETAQKTVRRPSWAQYAS